MKLQYLNEVLNPYFNNLTFYKAVKLHLPELRRIIMKFLQSKRVMFTKKYGWDSEKEIDFNDISKTDLEDRKSILNKTMSSIERGEKFFFASSDYKGKITIPDFKYKDFIINIEIATNETFFENGHDLMLNLRNEKENKSFSSKLDLTQKVDIVLTKMWDEVEEKINLFDSIEIEKKSYEYKKYPDSLIRKTFEYTIGKVVKRKKGEVSIVDTDEKSPIEFHLIEESGLKSSSSVSKPENNSFSISFKVKGFSGEAAWVKDKYPQITQELQRYKDEGGRSRISDVLDNKKLIGDEHEQIISRFEIFCDRVAKLGYYPKQYDSSYKKGEQDKLKFVYGGDKFKEKINSDSQYLKSKIKSKLQEVFYERFDKDYIRVSRFNEFIDKKLVQESFEIVSNCFSQYSKNVDMTKLKLALDKYKTTNEYTNRKLIQLALNIGSRE